MTIIFRQFYDPIKDHSLTTIMVEHRSFRQTLRCLQLSNPQLVLVVSDKTAEITARISWLAIVVTATEPLLITLREFVFWITHRHELSSNWL